MTQDITALVSSRICHDLISPIGAISNGVELITELSPSVTPELLLIEDSASTASAKVRYFRIAFGDARPEAQVSVSEMKLVMGKTFLGRSTSQLNVEAAHLPRPLAKALLLALLCVERALPLGGKIEASASDDGFTIEVQADRIAPTEHHWSLITTPNPETEVSASEVQFLLLGLEMDKLAATITTEFGETALTLRFTL